MHANDQLSLLSTFGELAKDLPFTEKKQSGLRYYYENDFYSYADAIFLSCMLLSFRPKRIVEVGSGYSSAVMLDINERFLDGAVDMTCIDPDVAPLRSLLKKEDEKRVHILEEKVQSIDQSIFASLQADDILFIDSSHVCKAGSDVHFLLFTVLPMLRPGVIIHIHDIFYPFEYPEQWLRENRAWNEVYAVRAFLTHNERFKIVLWNQYLATLHRPVLERTLPLCMRNTGGSLWLRKVR